MLPVPLYAFDLLMLKGKDVRMWPLDDRREQLHEIVTPLTSPLLMPTQASSSGFDV